MALEVVPQEEAPASFSNLLEKEMRIAFKEFEQTMEGLQTLFTSYLTTTAPCADGMSEEHCLLTHAKQFLRKEREAITQVTKGTALQNFDCVSQAIIACFLLSARGHEVTIARPKQLQRYFHALILEKNGAHFQIAGRDKQYETVLLRPAELVNRLRIVKAAMGTGIPQALHEHKKKQRKARTDA